MAYHIPLLQWIRRFLVSLSVSGPNSKMSTISSAKLSSEEDTIKALMKCDFINLLEQVKAHYLSGYDHKKVKTVIEQNGWTWQEYETELFERFHND